MDTNPLKRIKNEKGMAIVWMAILIAVLVAIAGLAVDIGYMYVSKTQLQNAADGAALAGAGNMDGTDGIDQTAAREAAFHIASSNQAASEPVKLGLNPNNAETGDIVVGNWNSFKNPKFLGTRNPKNAVKVVARRTTETPTGTQDISADNKQVGTFFGRIFSVVSEGSAGFPLMSAKADAIATPPPLATPGIVLCLKSCNITGLPKDFVLQEDEEVELGLAWTAYNPSQAPNVGKNGDVQEYIRGEKEVDGPLCCRAVTTNNEAGKGNALDALYDAFNDLTRDPDGKTTTGGHVTSWRVAVPIVTKKQSNENDIVQCNSDNVDLNTCNEGTETDPDCPCPPGKQGTTNERYLVGKIAIITITSVNKGTGHGEKPGITVSAISCIDWQTSNPVNYQGKPRLVQ